MRELEVAIALASRTRPATEQPHILPLILHGHVSVFGEIPILANITYFQYGGDPDAIARKIVSLGHEATDKTRKKWAMPNLAWEKYDEYDSWLDEGRKNEILGYALELIPKLKEHRQSHRAKLERRLEESNEFGDKSQAAWTRLSTTASESGYRLVVGFRDRTCRYREDSTSHGLGCFHCGFYAGTGGEEEATTAQLMRQLHGAFKTGFSYGKVFDVIEFLGDGSFLNDDEYNDRAKDRVFEFLARIPYIHRVLIESRPEHVRSQGIEEITARLDALRKDQHLEIGIGLETSDDFIRNVCLNKGFSRDAFEDAVNMVSRVNADYDCRCSVVAYVFVKPAFLTTEEAITDVLRTIIYLSDLSESSGVTISPKLEPAAIADGTLLSFLYRHGKNSATSYAPLNYWTVLEILTRASLEPKCKRVFQRIRVGGREDMDDVIKMPAVYRKDGRYDQFDFILYDAIQQFNQQDHHDLHKLYALLNNARKKGLRNLVESRGAFTSWARKELRSTKSAIADFIVQHEKAIAAVDSSYFTPSEKEFRDVTYCALDKLEGYDIDSSFSPIQRIGDVLAGAKYPYDEEKRAKVGEIMFDCFHQDNRTLFDIKILDIVREPDRLKRVFFEATDFVSGRTFVLWAGVPVDPAWKQSQRLAEKISIRIKRMVPSVFRSEAPKSERQLNDVIDAIVKDDYGKYQREFPITRFALATVVPDHQIERYNFLIECKYIRKSTTPSKASEGIAADITKYPEDKFILFVVYDPHRAIGDDETFRQDIEDKRDCQVTIVR